MAKPTVVQKETTDEERDNFILANTDHYQLVELRGGKWKKSAYRSFTEVNTVAMASEDRLAKIIAISVDGTKTPIARAEWSRLMERAS